MKFILGLTGPTGSGKTSACAVAERLGFFVVDCDTTARKATNDKACLKALAEKFGKDILNNDYTLNRKTLANKAFSSKEKTELLNNTIFPFILEILKGEINSASSDFVLLDAPTLFESGADSLCDEVCAVLADDQFRLERIKKRDNIDEASAKLRMSAGKSDEYYKSRTRHIIYNNKSEEDFINEFSKLLKTFVGG